MQGQLESSKMKFSWKGWQKAQRTCDCQRSQCSLNKEGSASRQQLWLCIHIEAGSPAILVRQINKIRVDLMPRTSEFNGFLLSFFKFILYWCGMLASETDEKLPSSDSGLWQAYWTVSLKCIPFGFSVITSIKWSCSTGRKMILIVTKTLWMKIHHKWIA